MSSTRREREAAVTERQALRGSLAAAVVLAVLAVAWGLAVGSRVVLLDGVYLVLGMGMSWLAIVASRAIDAGPSRRFPFGKESLAPLVVGIQGFTLLGTCAFAALDSVRVILDGGSEVAAGSVAVYAAISAAASWGVSRWLRRSVPDSDLIDAEARQWWAGALLSLVVLAGSAVALVLAAASVDAATRYVDPVLVLVACGVLLPQPLAMIRTMLVELLEGAAPADVEAAVRSAVERVRAEHGLAEPVLRLSKVGRKLYVAVDVVVEAGAWDVSDEDVVRRAVADGLRALPYELWLNVELTTDPDLLL